MDFGSVGGKVDRIANETEKFKWSVNERNMSGMPLVKS
jgi:hypothetical protein